MTKRKDYKIQVNAESYDAIVNKLFKITGDAVTIYGTINDDYLFYTDGLDHIKLSGGVKMRKYFILYTKYQTCWTCTYHILLTDKEKIHDEFLQEWDKQQEEQEEQEELGA